MLHLKAVEVEGPFDPPPLVFPEAHTRLMAHKAGTAAPRGGPRDRHAVRHRWRSAGR